MVFSTEQAMTGGEVARMTLRTDRCGLVGKDREEPGQQGGGELRGISGSAGGRRDPLDQGEHRRGGEKRASKMKKKSRIETEKAWE